MDKEELQQKSLSNSIKFAQLLTQVRCYSLHGVIRSLLLHLRGKSILVTGSCRQCGSCCRSISLEGRHGWLRSEKAFQEIIEDYPEYGRFVIIGKDTDGFLLFSCNWHTAEGGCSDYENRLSLCRKFPESSLVFAGGRLPPTCGYGFAEVVPFKKVLAAAVHRRK
jgi:uncharacterized protein